MSGESQKRISASLNEKLSGRSQLSNEKCIFRVHDRLRRHNPQAYEPEIVAIGPYHHGKSKLQNMEEHKLRYLQGLLHRRGETSVERYIEALLPLEGRARRCYAEEISLSKDDFVEMMCLDGCFLIETLRKSQQHNLRNDEDPIFQMDWLGLSVGRDLFLFENQLPLFVLVQLFDMTKFAESENLSDLAIPYFTTGFFPCRDGYQFCTKNSDGEAIHLLDLMHKSWCSSFAAKLPEIKDFCDDLPFEFIKSSTELELRGIKFEKAERSTSWLHITFANGVIKIPPFPVGDVTETFFRNLVAYEEYILTGYEDRRCVTDYAIFMDCLIDSSRDVERLGQRGIITNCLGDDAAVSTIINKLFNDVILRREHFCYRRLFKEVNEQSSRQLNIWKAHLMRNYFKTPWSIISFLAACFLILLATVQAIFSILQYTSGLTKQK
ncbi:unnamed protein product [Coffea canephora]|uniref:Uncharacterized protein n=1 Tax=Coffea canephora TaxID=49390 RepID=A0A068TTH8_COFCA|nr:unnamed protein product [Coffea canephora]